MHTFFLRCLVNYCYHLLQDTADVNIDSEEFKKLPHEIQHELIVEMHEKSKRHSRYQDIDMPEVQYSACFIMFILYSKIA